MSVIIDLKKENKSKNVKIEHTNKSIRMLNRRIIDKLEKILAMEKSSGNRYGLGFVVDNAKYSKNDASSSRPLKSVQNEVGSSRTMFVKKKEK